MKSVSPGFQSDTGNKGGKIVATGCNDLFSHLIQTLWKMKIFMGADNAAPSNMKL